MNILGVRNHRHALLGTQRRGAQDHARPEADHVRKLKKNFEK